MCIGHGLPDHMKVSYLSEQDPGPLLGSYCASMSVSRSTVWRRSQVFRDGPSHPGEYFDAIDINVVHIHSPSIPPLDWEFSANLAVEPPQPYV